MSAQRELIFLSSVGPDRDDSAWVVFTFANEAIKRGVQAEIFLTGAGTGLLRHEVRQRIGEGPKKALAGVLEAGAKIWYSPG